MSQIPEEALKIFLHALGLMIHHNYNGEVAIPMEQWEKIQGVALEAPRHEMVEGKNCIVLRAKPASRKTDAGLIIPS